MSSKLNAIAVSVAMICLLVSTGAWGYGVTPATPEGRAGNAFLVFLVGIALASYLYGWRGFLMSTGATIAFLYLLRTFPLVGTFVGFGLILWVMFRFAGSDSRK